MMMQLVGDTQQKLIYLQWNWDSAYDISVSDDGGEWKAVRLDDQAPLTAGSAEELRQKIHDDYQFQPVRRPPGWHPQIQERNSQ